jgi:hypothetical protein
MTTLQRDDKNQHGLATVPGRPASYGLIAEFDNVDAVVAAAHEARRAGYTRLDVHSPFPIHGLDRVLQTPPTLLPWLVLLGGLAGLFGALGLTLGTMVEHYPFMISGKPFASLPAFIPIIFECTILLAGIAATVAMLVMNKLPMLYHPLLKSERFRRVTTDKFFLVIEARDRRFDPQQTRAFLEEQKPAAVELVEE